PVRSAPLDGVRAPQQGDDRHPAAEEEIAAEGVVPGTEADWPYRREAVECPDGTGSWSPGSGGAEAARLTRAVVAALAGLREDLLAAAHRKETIDRCLSRVGSFSAQRTPDCAAGGSCRGSQAGAARFPGVLLSRGPLRACCYRSGSAAAARSRATDPAATRAHPAAILGLRRCTARATQGT